MAAVDFAAKLMHRRGSYDAQAWGLGKHPDRFFKFLSHVVFSGGHLAPSRHLPVERRPSSVPARASTGHLKY
jgi:hypothetical protein